MKLRALYVAALVLGVTALFASRGFSQHEGHDQGKQGDDHAHGDQEGGDEAAMMEALMKTMMPGEHHKHLEPLIGEWEYVTKWRMGAEEPWTEDRGTAKNEWILDGRYLVQQIIANGPDPVTNMRFEGRGLYGYDNLKKKHFYAWIDNMGTGLMTSEGNCDESGKVMEYHGSYMNPMTGKEEHARSVTRIINNNKSVFEMYARDQNGKEYMSLEVTSTRKG